MMVPDWLTQTGTGVRFEWGPSGAAALAPDCAALVVVDVLCFTTCVAVAVERGTRVYPYAWRDASAASFAEAHDAVLAVARRDATPEQPWTLSPAGLRYAPAVERLVLPSPNGSTIAAEAVRRDGLVVAACLRNAAAVGRWLAQTDYGTVARPVAVIAAGERWPDGSLRPSVEDALGAGVVIDALATAGAGPLSSEAAMAREVYRHTDDVTMALRTCASGMELIQVGYPSDVEAAAEVGASAVVPVLRDGAFTDVTASVRRAGS